ncbi:MAG: cupin domain-containing protein [Sphingomonadales bacterium]
MPKEQFFYNLNDQAQGICRDLAPGLKTRIFPGDQAMLSIVTIAPNAEGQLHNHVEEQWGVMLEGSGVRTQGGEDVNVREGDFWRTPANVPHRFRAGPKGARILDIFSPPREEYRKPGSGFSKD